MTGIPEVQPWEERVTLIAVGMVAVAAAAASVEHLAELARLAGNEGVRAWRIPACVDGLLLASAMSLFRARRIGQRVRGMTWFSLGLGLTASVAGNVISENPELVSPTTLKVAVAATPPISLALALHEALHQIQAVLQRRAPAPTEPDPPSPKPSSNGSKPKLNGKPSSRVDELVPVVREIRDQHGGKIPERKALRAALAARGEEGASNDTLAKVNRRLRAEAN